MFHLKFQRGDYSTNISCVRYDADRREGRAFVIPHKGFLDDGGVQFTIEPVDLDRAYHGPMPFDVCFITNEAGKTVDRIGPF